MKDKDRRDADGQRWVLDAAPWKSILPRLFYAAYKLWKKKGLAEWQAPPEDVVHEAILRTYEGSRVWDPSKTSLVVHLIGVIRSIYSDEDRRRELRREFERLESEKSGSVSDNSAAYADLEYLRKAMEHLKAEDPDLVEFFLEVNGWLAGGCTTDAEVERAMGITQGELYEKRKRIGKIINDWGGGDADADVHNAEKRV